MQEVHKFLSGSPLPVLREDHAALIAKLPKAELHVHLEGSMEPETVVELGVRHGVELTREEVAARYQFKDFPGFIEAFKWVTSFLRQPADYALVAERLAETLLRQNVMYAEVTLSVGVMLWRKQDAEANFLAVVEAGRRVQAKGLRLQWIFDCVRQFGRDAAMDVARLAGRWKAEGVVAFGMGGDELSRPTEEFRDVYEYAARKGLQCVVHAGETGSAQEVREAVEILGARRIGHGIAVMHDPLVEETLQVFGVSLEICPTSNLRTGALARQLGRSEASATDHPIRGFLERGLLCSISTDDPAMFGTSLNAEYELLHRLGIPLETLAAISMHSAALCFLPEVERGKLMLEFEHRIRSLGLV